MGAASSGNMMSICKRMLGHQIASPMHVEGQQDQNHLSLSHPPHPCADSHHYQSCSDCNLGRLDGWMYGFGHPVSIVSQQPAAGSCNVAEIITGARPVQGHADLVLRRFC